MALTGGVLTGPMTGTSAFFSGGLSANSLSANSLTASSATGFADESTIGYTAGGKLEVRSVPYTLIVYPFDLASLSFNTTSSPQFRFTDAEATTGTGEFYSTSVG